MIRMWIDNETVKGLISAGKTQVNTYGVDGRGKQYVTIYGMQFTHNEKGEEPLWWIRDIHESPLGAKISSEELLLPVSRISLRDSFPGNPRRDRGIYKLGTATVELELREYADAFEATVSTHTLDMFAEGGDVSQMFANLCDLWLAIKTGDLGEVVMIRSYEGKATNPKESEEVED